MDVRYKIAIVYWVRDDGLSSDHTWRR